MEKEWLQQLPKLDLHCHLDGSMSLKTVSSLLKEQGITIPESQLQYELQVSDDCISLTEYLKRFDLPIQCLQTERGLKQAASDLLKGVAAENVKYLEVRFAPMSSTQGGLNCHQVIESVLAGIAEAEQLCDSQASVIVCAMRHHSVEKNIKMLRCAREYLGKGICALDLAGDESTYPTWEQRELFQLARQLDVPFTIHSGECGSIENVQEAIAMGATRIGHGIALQKDKSLMNLCREKRIGIEMCPTSNFQTKAVNSWREYPLQLFLENGLLATINTDNRTVSNTSVTKELLTVSENIGLEKDIILQLLQNSVEISFADDNIKHRLFNEMRK